nr:succinylglutamate desuccinylase/aspartoacylase family protein [Thalassovita gelatinovora]
MQQAFDLPYAWVFTSGGGPNSTARTAMGVGNRNGVVSIMAELGGGGAVSPDILAMTERGLQRILHTLGMLPDYKPDAVRGTREFHAQGSVYAYQSGLFEPLKDIGDTVVSGETVGLIHHPDTPLQAADQIVSPYEGFVLCKRALAQIERGDAAFQIARDAEQR